MQIISVFLVLSLIASTVNPAFAAGAAKGSLVFATRQQYRACLETEDVLISRRTALEDRAAENRAELMRLQTEAVRLVEEQKALDLANPPLVDDFNRKMEAHNEVVKTVNAGVEKLNADLQALHAEMVEHNGKCATVAVTIPDRDAVLKELSAARKASQKAKVELK